MDSNFQRCAKGVLDTIGDPDIRFDEEGVSQYWVEAEKKRKLYVFTEEESKRKSNELVEKVKKSGEGKEYDCLIGLSGGVDSSYVALWAKKQGLRPLAVHFDNGWNSEIAVSNIKNICENLDIDLYTYVVNWEEFADLQRALIRASVVDVEMVTDNSHKAVSLDVARKHKIKYLLSGANFATENMMPPTWNWNKHDLTNLMAIHKLYGDKKIKSYKSIGQLKWFLLKHAKSGPKYLTPLNYLNYRKNDTMEVLKQEVGWRYYGGKHYESVWTKFYQAYLLPEKFKIDKRKVHLSSLILNKEVTRDEALQELAEPLYSQDELQNDKEYVLKKLKFTESEFDKIMSESPRAHTYYKSDYKVMKSMSSIWKSIKPIVKR